MNYTGRLLGVIFVVVNSIILIFHHWNTQHDLQFGTYEILFTLPYAVLGWWLGRIYDKGKYQSKELETSNKKFQMIFENAGIGIALLDNQGTPMVVNPRLKEILGYNEEELYNMKLDDVSHPSEKQINIELLKDIFEGKIVHYQSEKRFIRKDGEIVWAKVTASLFQSENNDLTYVIGTLNDITDLKTTQYELQEANKMLEYLSNRDVLTSIANRRYFDEHLLKEWERACSNSSPLSLIILDIDYFKGVNDTYGHYVGDECLKQVAGLLEKTVNRTKDLVARLGGEEFAVLLADTDAMGALVVAERLRSAIESKQIPHEQSSISDVVTISLGVASINLDIGSNVKDLIIMADTALYQAKSEGRNRVKFFNQEVVVHSS